MRAFTHAGGVVFRDSNGQVEYLLVRSSDDSAWVLPKGYIEDGERAEEAALREVQEESGVAAEAIGSVGTLKYYKGKEEVRARFFLMRATASGEPDEPREQRWGPLEEIKALLEHENTRALLDEAERLRLRQK